MLLAKTLKLLVGRQTNSRRVALVVGFVETWKTESGMRGSLGTLSYGTYGTFTDVRYRCSQDVEGTTYLPYAPLRWLKQTCSGRTVEYHSHPVI